MHVNKVNDGFNQNLKNQVIDKIQIFHSMLK